MNRKYFKFLKNKKVVLIGPSWHLKNYRQKELIDSYDVVVRMNLGYRIPSKMISFFGDRIDILYCSLSNYYFEHNYFNKKILNDLSNKLKFICLTHHLIHKEGTRRLIELNKKISNPIKIRIVKKDIYTTLLGQCKDKLSCGIVAISDLLNCDIKELYITGLTFYDTKVIGKRRIYYPGYNDNPIKYSNRPFGSHNLNKELGILKKFCKKDNRIRCDEILNEILKNNKVNILHGKK